MGQIRYVVAIMPAACRYHRGKAGRQKVVSAARQGSNLSRHGSSTPKTVTVEILAQALPPKRANIYPRKAKELFQSRASPVVTSPSLQPPRVPWRKSPNGQAKNTYIRHARASRKQGKRKTKEKKKTRLVSPAVPSHRPRILQITLLHALKVMMQPYSPLFESTTLSSLAHTPLIVPLLSECAYMGVSPRLPVDWKLGTTGTAAP